MTILSFSFEIRKPGYNQRKIRRQQKNIDYQLESTNFRPLGAKATLYPLKTV